MTSKIPIWRRSSQRARNDLLDALHTHAGLVLKTAGRVLGNVADAEDVAQDVAEKLLRKSPTNVQHWPALLKTMAVNRAIDQLRARRETESEIAIADLPSDRPQPEEIVAEKERAFALRRALARLKHREAMLFGLRYFADQSLADIAEHMGMNENSVSVALHRVRKLIADNIRQDLGLVEQRGNDK